MSANTPLQGAAVERPRSLVSVVVVNFNGRDLLRKCLTTVFRQSYRPMEVIVVDNGSTDGSVQMLAQEFAEVSVLANSDNRGFAEANNQGTARAKGKVVVLLNNDTEVREGWIEGLMDLLTVPGIGVVTSKVITDGVPERYYEMNGTINFLGYNIMRHFADTSMVFFAGGASLAFRKSEVPVPFPAEYFLYHEDVHLSWRMRLRGYQVRMAQGSVVEHRGSASTKHQASAAVTFYQERNRLLNTLVFYSRRTLVFLTPYLLMDAAAKTLVSLIGRGKSFAGIVRSYFWIFTHVHWIATLRRSIQRERVVDDPSILSLLSSKVLDGDGALCRITNHVSRVYATVTGLARHE